MILKYASANTLAVTPEPQENTIFLLLLNAKRLEFFVNTFFV